MIWKQLLALILPIVDKAIPDQAAAAKAKAELTGAILTTAADLENQRAEIIKSESASESWLTRSWRPIAMLNFLGLLDLYWFGAAPDYLVQSPQLVGQLFTLLTVGLGGYIAGRSLEKAGGQVARLIGGRDTAPHTSIRPHTRPYGRLQWPDSGKRK